MKVKVTIEYEDMPSAEGTAPLKFSHSCEAEWFDDDSSAALAVANCLVAVVPREAQCACDIVAEIETTKAEEDFFPEEWEAVVIAAAKYSAKWASHDVRMP